ncbi:MAG: hypothetical protein LBR65_07365 [Culturomica sp.]|nr:hypothetical protein [Culturomica sp.]
MRTIVSKLWIILAWAVLGTACERDGIEPGTLYGEAKFVPIDSVKSSRDYGSVTFTWVKPDSSSSLLYTAITWENPEGEAEHVYVPRHIDTVTLAGLATFEYTFHFRSYAEDGTGMEITSVKLSVEDWLQEPPAAVTDLSADVAEQFLILNWTHPVQRTYAGVKFDVYAGEELVKTVTVGKEEAPQTEIELKHTTGYRLVYYSFNARNIRSAEAEIPFTTGEWAPAAPVIVLNKSRIDYAHSGEITWTAGGDTDSLRISYRDLNGEMRAYHFDATTGKGYLSLLPGGKTPVSVQAKGATNTWSIPVVSELTTRQTTDLYRLRAGNGNTTMSKLSERFYNALGHGTYEDYKANPNGAYYTFAEMALLKELSLQYEVEQIDEIELLVNLETLIVLSPGPALANCPPVSEWLALADRLPLLKTLRVATGYPRYAELQAAFANHPQVTFE